VAKVNVINIVIESFLCIIAVLFNLHTKGRYVCLSVCMLPMAGRTAGPIKTKLGIGTHVDPGSVLVKVKSFGATW